MRIDANTYLQSNHLRDPGELNKMQIEAYSYQKEE